MLWKECVQRPWWPWWMLCTIIFYFWRFNAVTANDMLLSQVEINAMQGKFILNSLLYPSLREKEEPDFDHIWLCSPYQSKLDFCFGDDQYIACAINRDETARKLCFSIMKVMIHQFIARNRYCFNVYIFIGHRTRYVWRIGNCAGTTMDIRVRQTIQFQILWEWRKWKTFRIMIT